MHHWHLLLQCRDSLIVALGLSCSMHVRSYFPDQELNPSPVFQGRFSTTGPPGKSPVCALYCQLFISFISHKSISTFTESLALVNGHANVSPFSETPAQGFTVSFHCMVAKLLQRVPPPPNHFLSLKFTHILLIATLVPVY